MRKREQDTATAPADWATPERDRLDADHAGDHSVDHGGDDRYSLGELHARGGLGEVRRAHDGRLKRTVAIKELRRRTPDAEARFHREALITARLEHPGIVPVHDAGSFKNGSPYYAMKFISGRSLRERIEECTSFEERIALLPNALAVIEAISYAHSRGIIHRDLKPSNVIIGDYGETIVVDWGLAKPIDEREELTLPSDGLADGSADSGVTRQGAILGTPAYMPPEQARGEDVDERADVYALGALLYHLLAGAPPYRGASSERIVREVLTGAPTPIAERVPRAPGELVAIVEKAMARDAGARYRTAANLGADLRRYQAGQLVGAHRYSLRQRLARRLRRHRRGAVAIGMATLLGVAAYGLARDGAAPPSCAPDEAVLAGAWDAATRARVKEAMLASGLPAAESLFASVAAELDQYAAAWRNHRREACVETHHRGTQSQAALALRYDCLDRHKDDLSALTSALTADHTPESMQRALPAALALPAVSACGDVDQLSTVTPLPADGGTRRKIELVRDTVRRGVARHQLGDYAGAATLLEPALEQAREIGYAPLLAEALLQTGLNAERAGELEQSRAHLEAAVQAAASARDDALAARTWTELTMVVGDSIGNSVEAEALVPAARAAIERAGGTDLLRAKLGETLGVVAANARDWERARTYQQDAYRRYREALGDDVIEVAVILNDLGISHRRLGEHERAEEYYLASLEAHREALGERHPRVAAVLNNLGILETNRGNYRKAAAYLEESLGIKRDGLGEDHPKLANAMNSLGTLAIRQEQYERARELFSEALAIYERSGARTKSIANARANLGAALLQLGRHDEARPILERALAEHREIAGADHPILAHSLKNLGRLAMAQDRGNEALTHCREAVRVAAEHGGALLHESVMCRGEAELIAGDPATAERTLRGLLDEMTPGSTGLGETHYILARALVAQGRRAEAASHAATGRDLFASNQRPQRAKEIADWWESVAP